MTTRSRPTPGATSSYAHTPTKTIDVNGTPFAYRVLGPGRRHPGRSCSTISARTSTTGIRGSSTASLRTHRVITFDNRGVGASKGSTPTSIAAMARDAVSFIRALGLDQGRPRSASHSADSSRR